MHIKKYLIGFLFSKNGNARRNIDIDIELRNKLLIMITPSNTKNNIKPSGILFVYLLKKTIRAYILKDTITKQRKK